MKQRTAQCIRQNKNVQCDNCFAIEREKDKVKKKEVHKKQVSERMRMKHQETIRHNVQRREDAKKERLKEPICCKECKELFIRRHGHQLYCSSECTNRFNRRKREIRRRHQLKRNGDIEWDISIDSIIKKQGLVCKACGKETQLNDYCYDDKGSFIAGNTYPSIDHIKPVSKGGTHTWDNVQLLHRHCNTLKSNKDIFEFEAEVNKKSFIISPPIQDFGVDL